MAAVVALDEDAGAARSQDATRHPKRIAAVAKLPVPDPDPFPGERGRPPISY